MVRHKICTVLLAGVLVAPVFLAQRGEAAGPTVELEPEVQPMRKGHFYTVGLGAAAVPDYEGSEDYQGVPVIFFRATGARGWYVELLGNTLRANVLADPTWQLGPMARYRAKRDDVDNNRVDKMQSVDAAFEVGGFLGFSYERWSVKLEAVQDVADGHEGALFGLSGGYTIPMDPWRFTISASTSYASGDYMSAYFGVNGKDARRSGLDKFNADPGFKDVAATFIARYRFTDHWGALGAFRYTRLVGDAADSPLVEDEGDENQFLLGALVSYTF